jgi:hypothetical protein
MKDAIKNGKSARDTAGLWQEHDDAAASFVVVDEQFAVTKPCQ